MAQSPAAGGTAAAAATAATAAVPDGGGDGHTATSQPPQDNEDRDEAAKVIQRTFRGHRARRAMDGLTVDPSSRWIEALKEAQYRKLIRPLSRSGSKNVVTKVSSNSSTFAQEEWSRLRHVARRAGNDDTSDTQGDDTMTPEELSAHKQKKAAAKQKREAQAKTMGIEYFLEMMDEKHRYGSHLRAYHAEWKKADTHENFFYWLDYGEGSEVEVPSCSREALERDQVRYLSREERYKYLIKIDAQGRLCYAKNGARVTTSYAYRDSVQGIVPREDPTPTYREAAQGQRRHQRQPSDDEKHDDGSSLSSASVSSGNQEGDHYVNRDLEAAHGVKKVQYIGAGALMNHLLASTTKKNTWIFVADTSFRVYIGIKQSGAFQHSSFLQGARVSAAGIIKVKDGQIRSLSPLSGHYRPPTKNFRAFVKTLKERGADLSRVSISKSYAVLLGVEGYMKTKKRAKDSIKNLGHQADKLFRPDEARKREEKERDKSQSAAKEREFLMRERDEKWEKSLAGQFSRKVGIKSPPRSPMREEESKRLGH